MHPKVSIIVPCYNQAQYLDECLYTVLNQTTEDWECIIVNDGSPDNTEEIAKKWTEKDGRFQYVSKQNGGLSSARNAGVKLAISELILPLDADDKIGENYVSLATGLFYQNQNIKVVYCEAEKFGIEAGHWQLSPFSMQTLATINPIFCSAVFRKKDWEKAGGYDESMMDGLEDWEFWISILKNGGTVHKINEVCFFYRIRENSMIQSVTSDKRERVLDYICSKHPDFFCKWLGNPISLYKQKQRLEKFETKTKATFVYKLYHSLKLLWLWFKK